MLSALIILLKVIFCISVIGILIFIAYKISDTNSKQHLFIFNFKKIMATLADLQAAVAAEKTVIDSAITLLKGLHDKIAALEPNQEAIDALAAEIKTSTDSLSAAVTENTDPLPVTEPTTEG